MTEMKMINFIYNFLFVCRIQAFLKQGILQNIDGSVIKPIYDFFKYDVFGTTEINWSFTLGRNERERHV
jgi:hypothetical protein